MALDVELRHLTKQFGSVVAVDDVSLAVGQAEFVSLLGPSGCGKTTTLRMIAGFEEPTSGEILIGGRSVRDLPPHQRPVNTVFQHYALFPHLTVFENVAYGPRRRGVPKGEIPGAVREALRLVGLGELEARYPAQLSGGQQQRVALARALVNKPRVLLLDEPLGALDLKLRKQMQLELKKLQEQVGIAFLYVTHDQEEALTLSDRIGVMSQGRLIQFGTPREIYHAPASQFVADFIGESNLAPCARGADGRWALAGGLAVVVGAAPAGASRAVLSLRPEVIRISRDPLALANAFPAAVRSTVYLGSAVLVHAELAGELVLVVRVADLAFGESLKRGEQVFVGWEASDARLLPE
jgi:spermidine/putrescine transport system ATP-binding protein